MADETSEQGSAGTPEEMEPVKDDSMFDSYEAFINFAGQPENVGNKSMQLMAQILVDLLDLKARVIELEIVQKGR